MTYMCNGFFIIILRFGDYCYYVLLSYFIVPFLWLYCRKKCFRIEYFVLNYNKCINNIIYYIIYIESLLKIFEDKWFYKKLKQLYNCSFINNHWCFIYVKLWSSFLISIIIENIIQKKKKSNSYMYIYY